jgi:hypothetical protein
MNAKIVMILKNKQKFIYDNDKAFDIIDVVGEFSQNL